MKSGRSTRSPPANTVSPFQGTSALPLLLNWPFPSPTLKTSHRANVYQWQHFSQPTHSISPSHLIFIVSILERFGLLNSGNVSSWNASVLTCCTESLLFLFTRVLLANFYNYSRFYYSNRTRWNTSSKNMSELNISFLISCFWFMQKKINIRVGECAMNPDATQPTQALSFLCQRHRGLFFHFFLVFFFPFFLDFIFLILSASFLFPGSPTVTTEVHLCLLVILFQDDFDFSLVETSWSTSEKKKSVLSTVVPASVSQCDSLLWISSLSSGTQSLHSRFSCSEKHLGRGQRLQGIFQMLKKVHLLVAAKHSSLAWIFAHLLVPTFPLLPSHIGISSVKHADWGQLFSTG